MRRCTVGIGAVLFCAGSAFGTIFVNGGLAGGANDGSSWANAFRGPQALHGALAAATADSGTQIWVAAGQYTPAVPSGSRTISFVLKSGVEVYGGFVGGETLLSQRDPIAHVTILSGDLNGNDLPSGADGENSLHVMRGTGLSAATLVDGLTIRGGRASGSANLDDENGANVLLIGGSPVFRGCTFSESFAIGSGGGAALINSSPRFAHCKFVDNTAQGTGGGIANLDGGSPIVESCEFTLNVGGHGAGIYTGSSLLNVAVAGEIRVVDCDFDGNIGNIGAASGIGMMIDRAAAKVSRSRFHNNVTGAGGGGIYVLDSPLEVVSCDFSGNSAPGDGGGGVYVDGGSFSGGPTPGIKPRFANCRFVANNGAIFVNFDGTAEAVNCTFANNSFGFSIFVWPALLAPNGSTLTIRNSIVWGNKPFFSDGLEGIILGGGLITLDSCCVERWDGSRPGVGTFGDDPLFVDGDGGDGVVGTADDDVRLTAGSPCVEIGVAGFLPADVTDVDDDGNNAEPVPLDLAGSRRVANCGIDLGAYERFGGSPHSGDMDGDGLVALGDVGPFVTKLLTAGSDCVADVNADGACDGRDVSGFVACLVSGGCG